MRENVRTENFSPLSRRRARIVECYVTRGTPARAVRVGFWLNDFAAIRPNKHSSIYAKLVTRTASKVYGRKRATN